MNINDLLRMISKIDEPLTFTLVTNYSVMTNAATEDNRQSFRVV